MADANFIFNYNPSSKGHTLDAYDASQALYGIARSISILTHYTINRRIIKQALALKGARVVVEIPKPGSFIFPISVFQNLSEPGTFVGAVAAQFAAMALYDLTKLIFSRLTGKPEQPKSELVQTVLRGRPGDIDALTDTVEDDIVRIHRPLIHNVTNISVIGGSANLVMLDHESYDFALTTTVSKDQEAFVGHVTSFNGSTISGRFWIDDEERTVGFSVDKNSAGLTSAERRLLSKSLDDWVNRLSGEITLVGRTLRSKQGLLKHIFVADALDHQDDNHI